MGGIVSTPLLCYKLIYWRPSTLEHKVNTRWDQWALIQHGQCPDKKTKFRQRYVQRKDNLKVPRSSLGLYSSQCSNGFQSMVCISLGSTIFVSYWNVVTGTLHSFPSNSLKTTALPRPQMVKLCKPTCSNCHPKGRETGVLTLEATPLNVLPCCVSPALNI